MKDCVLTLQSNAKINVLYAEKGRELLERIGREGMNEAFADEIRSYISECTCKVGLMNSIRKPFTAKLTEWQKQFVTLEKGIDPAEKGSPAYEAANMLRAYLKKQMNEANARAFQLQKNRDRTGKRIAGRDDLTEEEKAQALQKADSRLKWRPTLCPSSPNPKDTSTCCVSGGRNWAATSPTTTSNASSARCSPMPKSRRAKG